MTQEEAKTLLHAALMSAIKGKSNLLENVGDDATGLLVLNDMEPNLFPENDQRINLVEALTRYEQKLWLERGNVANIISLISKSPITELGMALRGHELPSLMGFLRGEFEDPEGIHLEDRS